MDFGFIELVKPYEEPPQESAHEQFIYVLCGTLDAKSENEHEVLTASGIMHIPKGSRYSISSKSGNSVRYVTVTSTDQLETKVLN